MGLIICTKRSNYNFHNFDKIKKKYKKWPSKNIFLDNFPEFFAFIIDCIFNSQMIRS